MSIVLGLRQVYVSEDKLMIDLIGAQAIAENMVDSRVRPDVYEAVEVMVEKTIRTEKYWIFFYNTVEFLRTGSEVHALAGNGPIVIDRITGAARFAESGRPWEEQV